MFRNLKAAILTLAGLGITVAARAELDPITDPTTTVQTAVNASLTFGLTTMGILVGVGTLIWVVKKARKGL